MDDSPTPQPVASPLPSAILLIAAAVLASVFMALHPTSHAHTPAEFAADAASGMRGNGPVHGILVGLGLLLATGFLALADRLGPTRLLVRLGSVALLVGTLCGVFAGLVNGFIVPMTAATYVGQTAAEGEALTAVLRLCRAANATLATVDVIGLSMAAILWAVPLLTMRGAARILGCVGLGCGAIPLLLLIAGRLPMTIHGFGFFVLLQSVWGIATGIWMLRGR
jgi:hypothetical protein